MNEASLETIEQIREFLAGTADIAFSVPTEEAKLRQFVVTVLQRVRYFGLARSRDEQRDSVTEDDQTQPPTIRLFPR